MIAILFVVDGGQSAGLGHVVRSIALASYMKRKHCVRPIFCMLGKNGAVAQRVLRCSKDVLYCLRPNLLAAMIRHSVCQFQVRVVIYDLQRGLPTKRLVRAAGSAKTVAFVKAGQTAKGNISPTLCFVQGIPVPPPKGMKCLHGLRYVVLDEAYCRRCARGPDNSVFLSGGGSDPLDVTGLMCEVLQRRRDVSQVHVLLGPFYKGKTIKKEIYSDPRFRFYRNVNEPWKIMARCGTAVLSYGMIVLEALSLGLPTLAVSISRDHLASAKALEGRYNALLSAGLASRITLKSPEHLLDALLNNKSLRARLRIGALQAIDGQGAKRVACAILSAT